MVIANSGAILGARPHTRPRTIADAHGAQSAVLGVKLDPQDQPGRLVETYGSEGWGFESLRVRSILPSQGHFFDRRRSRKPRTKPVDSNLDSNAVQFGWTKTRSMASAASRSAVGITWE
jgi:hypothetical protein